MKSYFKFLNIRIWHTTATTTDNRFGGFLNRYPPVTRNILLINIVMFIATLINQNFMVSTFAMFYPASPFFRIWQPITYLFMHGGFWHLFFNMFCLPDVRFGAGEDDRIKEIPHLLFRGRTGSGADPHRCGIFPDGGHGIRQFRILTAGQINLLRTPTLGASGAIYGIQIGYAMLYPNDIWTLIFPPISLKAKWFVLIFIAIELFTGVTGTMDGVAHFAHLGGMLFGFLLLVYWKKSGKLWQR